jgi:hypothetical protein
MTNKKFVEQNAVSNDSNQRLPVKGRTLRQVKILAVLQGRPIADLVGQMVDAIWQQATIEGYVNERMLEDVKLAPEGEGETGGISYVQKIQE